MPTHWTNRRALSVYLLLLAGSAVLYVVAIWHAGALVYATMCSLSSVCWSWAYRVGLKVKGAEWDKQLARTNEIARQSIEANRESFKRYGIEVPDFDAPVPVEPRTPAVQRYNTFMEHYPEVSKHLPGWITLVVAMLSAAVALVIKFG